MCTWTMYNRKLFVLVFPVFIQGFIDNIHTPLVKELFSSIAVLFQASKVNSPFVKLFQILQCLDNMVSSSSVTSIFKLSSSNNLYVTK